MRERKGDKSLENIRHTLAHLLAAAVLEKRPEAKLGIGPTIENGFYYDFDLEESLTPEDLPKLEKRIRELIKQDLKVAGNKVTPATARKLFKNQPYKLELIQDFVKEKKKLTVYKTGEIFSDLCRGGHAKNTKEIDPDAFKLTHLAGAYWKGGQKNPQLQRVYGVAFTSRTELDEYLNVAEEAKKRDHKVLGTQLELFMFHETAPGSPYWLPRGLTVFNQLVDYWRREHEKRGYQEISSPLVNKKELWITSGHWEHYQDDMFIADMGEGEIYGVKPMNCPNAMLVFQHKSRSYRDLPLRLSDSDVLHRYERSGVLNGLLRARSFRQDDSHNFITEDQIESEYTEIFKIADQFYKLFDLKFSYRLGTRPKKFMGEIKIWDRAEKALHKILTQAVGKDNYFVLEGDGAFYGPKVDIIMKDSLGRDWQMGTIQLDFQIPQQFGLAYVDKDGKEKVPVVIHRVIYGSIERFIGILIEHYAGAFPLWLSPVQVQVIAVSEKFQSYAQKITQDLRAAGIRTELAEANETLGKRIREGETQKIPYLLIVGERENKEGTVAVRKRGKGDMGTVTISSLIKSLQEEIAKHS